MSALVPDMPDRMIAATAVSLGAPLVTRDPDIQRSGISSRYRGWKRGTGPEPTAIKSNGPPSGRRLKPAYRS